MQTDLITYREFSANPLLCDWIKTYWHFKTTAADACPFDIIPDGYFDLLLIYSDGNFIDARLTGIWDKMLTVHQASNTDIFGIRFKPIVSYTSALYCINELINSSESIELKDIMLTNNVFEIDLSAHIQKLIKYLDIHFLKIFSNIIINPSIAGIFKIIDNYSGSIDIKHLSAEIGYSTRHIHRISKNYLGIGIKEYSNIVRFRDSLLACKQDSNNYLGYFDQSHFIKSFKKITGTTPQRLNIADDVRFLQYYIHYNS